MPFFGKTNWGQAHFSGTTQARTSSLASFADLGAFVRVAQSAEDDLSAEIRGSLIRDLPAVLSAVSPVDINADVQPIPGEDIKASTLPVPGVNLGAFGGGHFPENIKASLSSVLPVNLLGEIRPTKPGQEDLTAALQQIGALKDLSSYVKTATRQEKNLEAKVRVIAKGSINLPSSLMPFNINDLSASLITERVFNVSAIISGYGREIESDLSALVQRVDSASTDLSVEPLRAVVSTHTSDKVFNLDKVARRFFENRYMFGTRSAGLALVTLEPIFGEFPDLHADIFARDFERRRLGAFLRPATRVSKDLPTLTTSVLPFINVNKILLELIPLINMDAELVQAGGYLPVRASITPRREASTGTSPTAGFATTARSYRFYLGTNRGVLIPPQVPRSIKIETYQNDFPLPDLHGTITGWNEANLGAFISDYSFKPLPAELVVFSIDRLSHITASIGTFNIYDMPAFVNPSGGWSDLISTLQVDGAVNDIGARVIPAINPLSFTSVNVSTKPFSNLGAIINYNALSCAPTSSVQRLAAFLKPIISGTAANLSNLGASLVSRRMEIDLSADVVARKRTRINVLNLTFRSKIRDSSVIRGSITPLVESFFDIKSEIKGIPHEYDIPASIQVIRYSPTDVDFTAVEIVGNLEEGTVKDVLVSFRSQVSSYIYEETTNAVYTTDRGTWAIDLRTLLREDSFFDRSALNRELEVSDLKEYYSLDEALRQAFVLLCERRQSHIGASLLARGAVNDLGAQVSIISGDRLSNLSTKLVAVKNSPDIAAVINQGPQSSQLDVISAVITSEVVEKGSTIKGSIIGNIINDLGAEVIAS